MGRARALGLERRHCAAQAIDGLCLFRSRSGHALRKGIEIGCGALAFFAGLFEAARERLTRFGRLAEHGAQGNRAAFDILQPMVVIG